MDKIPYKGNLVISLEYDSFEILFHNLIIGILNKYVYLINPRKSFEIENFDFPTSAALSDSAPRINPFKMVSERV